jgi:uncharacterized metal-binding protein YceD (DUF177 family)
MAETRVLATAKITRAHPFVLTPGTEEREALAEDLDIRGIRKLTFRGEVTPSGGRDLTLEAELGATVVQDCVVTGEPVVTRIDTGVTRRYLADYAPPGGDEVEMPEDDSAEPLPAALDLYAVMTEALALELPLFPRAEGVDPVDLTVTEPGVAPMTDDDAKPFAGLKALRDKLSGSE